MKINKFYRYSIGHVLSRITFWVIVSFYIIVAIALLILYLLGKVNPSSIPSDWWSALGVISTLTFFIIVITYFREKEYIETGKNLSQKYDELLNKLNILENGIKKNKDLATLSTIVLDITTDNYSNKEKWEANFDIIKELYKANIINEHNLYRISMEAWKQKEIAFAFRLRMLALYQNQNDNYWKTRILEIIPYVNHDDFVRFDPSNLLDNFRSLNSTISYMGLKTKDQEVKMNYLEHLESLDLQFNDHFYALYGRYEYKKGNFENALTLFSYYLNNFQITSTWPYRFLLGLYIRNNEKINFQKTLNSLEMIYKSKSEPDYSSELFIQFMNFIKNIWNGGSSLDLFDKSLLIRAFNVTPINKFTMWHFYQDINESTIMEKQKNLMTKQYGIFYSFLGEEDINAEEKFDRNKIIEMALK